MYELGARYYEDHLLSAFFIQGLTELTLPSLQDLEFHKHSAILSPGALTDSAVSLSSQVSSTVSGLTRSVRHVKLLLW